VADDGTTGLAGPLVARAELQLGTVESDQSPAAQLHNSHFCP
jgi:hypothetical protein